MGTRHLTEIGLPTRSFTFARPLCKVLDGPIIHETPRGVQIGRVEIGRGHAGGNLTLMEVSFCCHPTKRSGSRISRSVWTNKDREVWT
jgi:hypothetical protein